MGPRIDDTHNAKRWNTAPALLLILLNACSRQPVIKSLSSQPTIRLTLSAAPDNPVFRLTLIFQNTGATEVPIEKYNAYAEGRIEQDLFEIVTERGDRLPYTGALFKRGRAGPDDYVAIGAGESFTATVELATAYRMLSGTHTYRATYAAMISYPDRDGFWELTSSNAATVTVTRP